MTIIFGPAGIGRVKDVEETFKEYSEKGIRAAEIPFTYSVFIKDKKTAETVRNAAEKYNIKLSIHAPYWINLNSVEKEKIKASKQRILKCCEIGTYIGVSKVVFHPGYYGKMNKEESYENIKNQILELEKIIKEKKYTPKLAPETTGKLNVFGSIDEIQKLVKDTGCSFCIDFAHILARYKDYHFKEVLEKFVNYGEMHIHFSGIEHGEKGEKSHKRTPEKELKKIISNLPSGKKFTIINESPFPVEDTLLGLRIYNK